MRSAHDIDPWAQVREMVWRSNQAEDTCSWAEIREAVRGFSAPRDWLTWALTVVQKPPKQLSPDGYRAQQLKILGFLASPYGRGIGEDPHAIALPTRHEMRDIRRTWGRLIQGTVSGQPVDLDTITVRRRLVVRSGLPYLEEIPAARTGWDFDDSYVREAREAFIRLLETVRRAWQEAGYTPPFIRECPAPKPYTPDERCGTWFCGRPDQRYCSELCQHRVRTQRHRQKPGGRKVAGKKPRSSSGRADEG